jgi:DNA-binding MarR family transcriptional regulator
MSDQDVYRVQQLYPQIYLACHVDHVRAVSTEFRISSQDGSILVHLDQEVGLSPRTLAKHLGVVPSTLSAAIARLEKLGYLTSTAAADDKRKRELRLTLKGATAVSAASVLDASRVRALLQHLSASERKTALEGLSLLGRAARQMKETEK